MVLSLPDPKQIIKEMNMSNRRDLISAMGEGDSKEVQNRLEDFIEKTEKESGSIPMKEDYRKVPVVQSDGEWKAVIRQYVEDRIESGRNSLTNLNLEAAEETLAYAEKIAPGLKMTQNLAKKVAEAQNQFDYADSVKIKASSVEVRRKYGFGGRSFVVAGDAEIRNTGERSIKKVAFGTAVDIEESRIPDTTVAEVETFDFSESPVEGGGTRNLSFRFAILEKFDPDYESKGSFGFGSPINKEGVEFRAEDRRMRTYLE